MSAKKKKNKKNNSKNKKSNNTIKNKNLKENAGIKESNIENSSDMKAEKTNTKTSENEKNIQNNATSINEKTDKIEEKSEKEKNGKTEKIQEKLKEDNSNVQKGNEKKDSSLVEVKKEEEQLITEKTANRFKKSIKAFFEKLKKKQKEDLKENKKVAEDSKKEENSKNENKPKEDSKKETKQKEDTSKKENKETDKKQEDGKPEYVEQMLKNKKRKTIIFISITALVILAIVFSTVFALLNLNNSNIINGISVKYIDISKLSTEDAKNKITESINKELMPEINLKYGDSYEITLKPEQIEFKYDIDKAVDNAYLTGRNNNIVFNNYTLLKTNFLGKNIDLEYTYKESLLEQFIDNMNSEIPGVVIEPSYYIEEAKLIVNKGTDGIEIDKENLKNQIISAILSRNSQEIVDDTYKQELAIPVKEKTADSINMTAIKEEIYKEPQNAYFETEPYQIYPDVDGVDLAISAEEAQQIVNSEVKEEYTFDLNISKAEITIKDLGKEAFPYLVSSFTTKYDASNVNRSTNLKIAAGKINGTVLMPGEEFSYNKVVGKRTVEEGYRDAKIYANGSVVDGLGGGICQISSTLYNAVLLANLEVTERKNHSYTTSYVPAGRDATVVYGVKDFKFKNSRNYPIKIEATVNNGIAEFKIYGVQEEKEYEIKILPVTTASIPYSTSYVQDASLAPGQQVVSQSGHLGYKVTTYKEVRYNGEVISKEIISNDTYSPMQTVVRVGPGVVAQ